jgi:hypothetical protein
MARTRSAYWRSSAGMRVETTVRIKFSDTTPIFCCLNCPGEGVCVVEFDKLKSERDYTAQRIANHAEEWRQSHRCKR